MTGSTTDLASRRESLLSERATWEQDWKLLAKHFLPRKCRLEKGRSETNQGGLRGGVLDSTGILSMRDLAAGLHGGMTSPARPWFRLTLEDQEMSARRDVRTWLDAVEKRMRSVLNRSNFYNAVHHLYGELGAFGTGFMFALADEKSVVRFLPLTVGEYCLDVDEHGRVDTIFRSSEMTLRQIIRRFEAPRVPSFMHALFEKPANWNERFSVIHAVYPRRERQSASSSASAMPFASVYYLEGGSLSGGRGGAPAGDGRIHVLSESGFAAFPGFGPRWDVTGGDVYGRSPGMDVLPDSILLQQMVSSMLQALHKEINPPMVAPEDLKSINLLPGGANFVNSTGGSGQQVYPAVQVRHNIEGTQRAILGVREQVKEGLFNNLFRMLLNSDRRQITAREVAAREEEKLILIGPVLERLHDELFIPLIDRVIHLMREKNILPEPPPCMQGVEMKVEFVSILAQAQKMVGTSTIEQFAGFIGQSAQLFPEVLDAIDPDKVVDAYAGYLGVEAGILRGQNERREQRETRDGEAAQAKEMQQGAALFETLGKAGAAGKALNESMAIPKGMGAGGMPGADMGALLQQMGGAGA